jgi:hypothetical protein
MKKIEYKMMLNKQNIQRNITDLKEVIEELEKALEHDDYKGSAIVHWMQGKPAGIVGKMISIITMQAMMQEKLDEDSQQ